MFWEYNPFSCSLGARKLMNASWCIKQEPGAPHKRMNNKSFDRGKSKIQREVSAYGTKKHE
ncbi:MAG: hypothetical protein ACXW4Z_12305 [Candidatus Binatia bacterium]